MAFQTDQWLTSRVKDFCRSQGADLVGVASMDRFEGAPKQMDPRYIFPDAKAMLVFAFRIPRGALRGIEEGTWFTTYSSMGYSGINFVRQPVVLWSINNYLEDEGYESVPIHNNFPWCNIKTSTGEERPEWSRPVSPDKPAPDVFFSLRIAAVAAGLGELGYSKLFLSPEFGPRQRLAAVLTDAPLVPDPLFDGEVCDRCMQCANNCPGAISKEETTSVTIGGKTCTFGKFDVATCSKNFQDPAPEYNPFLGQPSPVYFYGRALEGGRGCMRACMVHLEETGRLEKPFRNRFRTRKPWKIQP